MVEIKIIFFLFVFPILYQIAGFLGILWCLSLLACFFAPVSVIPTYVYPLVLYGFMVFFLINPTKTFYYKSRFWLLKLLVSPEICVSFLEWYIDHWLPPEWKQNSCIAQLQKACSHCSLNEWYPSSRGKECSMAGTPDVVQ